MLFCMKEEKKEELITMTQDCPICMDAIDMAKNCSTTTCGHCFHTSCLVRNIMVNGIKCPYCRTVMIISEKQEEDWWAPSPRRRRTIDEDGFVTVRNRRHHAQREHIIIHFDNEY